MRDCSLQKITGLIAFCILFGCASATSPTDTPAATYTLAVGGLGPVNNDLFIADGDGANARPLSPYRGQDQDGRFSADGGWIYFSSDRAGGRDIFRIRPNGADIEQLTDYSGFDGQPSPSPDGSRLAFVSSRGGQADLWILNLRTRDLTRLTDRPLGDFRPAWSPDGDWIAFSGQRDALIAPPARLSGNDVFIVRPDGRELKRLTDGQAFAGSPAWSADSQTVVFYEATMADALAITDARGLRGNSQIISINIRTGERRMLTEGAGEKWSPRFAGTRLGYVSGGPDGGLEFLSAPAGSRGVFVSPDWTADGRRMIFHRDVATEWPPHEVISTLDSKFQLVRTGIFASPSPDGRYLVSQSGTGSSTHDTLIVVDRNGENRRTLVELPDENTLAPSWSPQGDLIAVGAGSFFQQVFNRPASPASRRNADIIVMRPDGSGFRRIAQGSGVNGFPSFAPDGRRIVFRTLLEPGKGLKIVDIDTGEIVSLTDGKASDTFPAWSPRGDRIAFVSNRTGDFEIYSMNVDGSDVRQLTTAPGNDSHLSWSPDGEWIAFSSGRGGVKDEAVLRPRNPQPFGDIFVMRADGTDVRRLTDDEYEDGTVAWFPRERP